MRTVIPTVCGIHWDSGKASRLKESSRAVILKREPSDHHHQQPHLTDYLLESQILLNWKFWE